jgi:hypothetical protein
MACFNLCLIKQFSRVRFKSKLCRNIFAGSLAQMARRGWREFVFKPALRLEKIRWSEPPDFRSAAGAALAEGLFRVCLRVNRKS